MIACRGEFEDSFWRTTSWPQCTIPNNVHALLAMRCAIGVLRASGWTATPWDVQTAYFGGAGAQHICHALACALLADVAGIVPSVLADHAAFT